MKTCRICLKVGVKMFRLGNTVHKDFIESIIKLQGFSYVLSENHYACYICVALLSKFYNFTQMVVNAQKVLCDLLIANEELTIPVLMNINRHEKGLNLISLSYIYESNSNEIIYDRIENKSNTMHENQHNSYVVNADNSSIKEEIGFKMNDSGYENMEEPFEDKFNVVEVKKESIDPLVEDIKMSEENSTGNCYIEVQISAESVLMESYTEADEPESKVMFKTEHSNSSEIERLHTDDDVNQPESTSHYEDFDFDSYNYKGKPKKKPKVNNRTYPRKCDHCNYRVQRAADHYRHYQYTHPDAEYPYGAKKDYACSICGQIFSIKRIKEHESSHKNDMKIKCSFCPKICETRKKLHAHRSRAHPKTTYTCDYCSKVFKTRTDIMRHIRIHTGEKPFKCHICGAGFAHSGNRKIHILSSHQNYNYTPKEQKQTQNVSVNKKYTYLDTEIQSSDLIPQNKCNIKGGNGHTNPEMKSEEKKQTKKTMKTARKVQNSTKGDNNTNPELKKRHPKRMKKARDIDDNIIAELDSIWNH